MQDTQIQIVVIIIAITVVLLFIGILFLVMIWSYNNKKLQMAREKQQIQDAFEKQLLQSKLEIQEEIFNDISQEIHDNVGQLLSFAKVQLNIIEQQSARGREDLKAVKETIGSAFTALRSLAKSLSSDRVQAFALTDNIREEVRRMQRAGVDIVFNIGSGERPVNQQSKLLLFRMIQEALQNILKHARATQVVIDLQYQPETLQVTVHDNGAGFNVDQEIEKKDGLGLQNILNRARLIGGTATISSSPEEGTSIHIIVPYA
ncbi:sensor histidine kinase [Chitinophaga japonensis]|uniref:histidine kinase n=1 Tax=Chitinophaga japonensis TaxID=104662 RepID=A0A562SMR4_CHIJA|nr:ATP-binding protein [Chitinophaga japonensis]TWI81986.1 signal transduction histidine kinase [Chitinophaga japonensis]